ncbi:OLC1v1038369C1 [Oldenlandia corymbosa var. corymbosa]|uniref:OLC1v1038369C1 n=1 Tax=Oldenlandia corymbosa var. corymbosa TaxID=529605 RepID=A0AAV1D1X2_OLDCO|nr:OLC1v1038369C1 [Oldenlandia corymbosa var. corymbosa]
MYDPERRSKSRRSTNLASCLVATVFLVLLAAAAVLVYFLIFKPKPPRITVDAVQFPTFSVSNGTLNFTFFQFVTVTNPNRDQFTHYDSSLQLAYSGQPLGLVFIPAGEIDGGRAQHMSAKFDVHAYPLPPQTAASTTTVAPRPMDVASKEAGGGDVVPGPTTTPTMEIETRMKLEGRVRVLKVFTHRVQSGVRCGVVVELSRGAVLAVRC